MTIVLLSLQYETNKTGSFYTDKFNAEIGFIQPINAQKSIFAKKFK